MSTSKKIIPRIVSTVQFNKIYDEIIRKQEKKLVVVIDNLDRCEDTVAVELLGIIQTFMVKENCINILACDDESLVTHLKNVKKNYTDKDGNEFLSKFFQVTIRIPPFIGENLSTYADKLMKKRSVEFDPLVKLILISGAIENPRKVNQFLNIAVAWYRLAKLKEDAGRLPQGAITKNTPFLMKMIIIRHDWPDFYKALELYPDLINNDDAIDRWVRKQVQGDNSKDKDEELRLLKIFHNATKHAHVNDVTPFLKLNQESYAALSGIDTFEDAFITLHPKAVEIFKKLDTENQEDYLHKIKDTMKKYEEVKAEKLILFNCASSLIAILQHISDTSLRTTALAILGNSISLHLLEHLDKFDIEKSDLFHILECLQVHFSKPIYDQLLVNIFDKDELNEELLEKFFKNGAIINKQILDQIDSQLTQKISDKSYLKMDFIVKCICNYDWMKNNITKPSKIVSYTISQMNFDGTQESQIFEDLYAGIKDHIVDDAKKQYTKKIRDTIIKSVESNNALSPQLVQHLTDTPIHNSMRKPKDMQDIFEGLCNSINNNPDMTQNEQILKLIIPLYQKIQKSAAKPISSEYLEKAFKIYAGKADPSALKRLTDIISSSSSGQFLKSKTVILAIIERYMALGSTDPEIIRFLLKNPTDETEYTIIEKFEDMIASNEESKFTTLLATAKGSDTEFDSELITKIGKMCLANTLNTENPIKHSMYESALELNPDSYNRSIITNYAETLIREEDMESQDRGFALLRKINSEYFNNGDPIGIANAISIATNLIDNNSERFIQYFEFINTYSDRFNHYHISRFILLLQKVLQSNASENILNHITLCVKKMPKEIIINLRDELVAFAKRTTYVNAKEQCKLIFIAHKENLKRRHKKSIKEIFGENVLD